MSTHDFGLTPFLFCIPKINPMIRRSPNLRSTQLIRKSVLLRNLITIIASAALATGCASPISSPSETMSSSSIAREIAAIEVEGENYQFFIDTAVEAAMQAAQPDFEKNLKRELTLNEGTDLKKTFEKMLRQWLPEGRLIEILAGVYADKFSKEELSDVLTFAEQTQAVRHSNSSARYKHLY